MATFELEFESTSEVGAQNVSLGYLSLAGDLLYQTANYNLAGRPYQVVCSTVGSNSVYKRTTKLIDPAGVVSNSTETDVVIGAAGFTSQLDVKNIPGSPFIQAIQFQGFGTTDNTVAWVASGIKGPTIAPAFGTNYYQTAGEQQRAFIYVSGYGVFGFQAGSTGDPVTSCAIALYGAVSPNSMPTSSPTASVEVSSTDGAIGNRMAGKDAFGNIYCLVTIGGGSNRFLQSYTPELTLRWSFALPANHPLPDGSTWGSYQDAVVVGNGSLLVVTNRDLDGKSIYAFTINPGAESFTFLDSQQITDTDSAADIASIVDECHVWYYRIPALWRVGDCFVVVECGDVGIDQIVYDLATRAGIPASRIDVSGIAPDSEYGMIFGMGAGRPASARQLIELLQNHSFFDMTEQGGIITASRRDRDAVGLIGGNDLRAHAYGETAPTLCERERTEDYEIPREVRVQYTQALAEYEPGVEGYARRVTDAEGVVDIDLSAIAMEPDEAAVIAEASMLEVIVAREQLTFHLVATPENKLIKAGDITTLDVRGLQNVIRITEIGYAFPGILKIQALRHDPTVYSSDAVGVGRRLIGSIITSAGSTTFELLDAPLVREFDDVSGYFAALGGNMTIPGILEGWPGGDLQRQEPAGWEDIARILRPGSVFGTAVNALPDAPYTIVTDDELLVSIENDILESVPLQQMLLGANLAALEVPGGWELIRFTTAVFDDPNWRITGIARGVNGTEWATADHAIGDRFVLLTGVAQILTDIALEVNQSWQHNAATIGQLPNAIDEVSFTWTGVDRIPYAPVHLNAERESDDDLLLAWTRRDRIGRELQSGQTLPLSESSEAYEVDIYNGAGDTVLRTLSVTSPEATYTAAQQTSDFGSLQTEIDFAVYQIGALGRGYPGRTTIEGL